MTTHKEIRRPRYTPHPRSSAFLLALKCAIEHEPTQTSKKTLLYCCCFAFAFCSVLFLFWFSRLNLSCSEGHCSCPAPEFRILHFFFFLLLINARQVYLVPLHTPVFRAIEPPGAPPSPLGPNSVAFCGQTQADKWSTSSPTSERLY